MILFVKKQWQIEKQLRLIIKIIFAGMIIMSFFLGSMLLSVLRGHIYESIFWPQMTPFDLSFRVDGLSIIMAILTFVLWSIIFIYSIKYIKNNVIRYYTLLLLILGSVQDTIFAGDLVNFYIFLEITTIVTYFLITHNKDAVALKAGYKYLIMLLAGAFLILLSILFAYSYMGNYKMSSIIACGYIIAPILFLIGCFVKAGAIPLHVWLPDAHPAAPSPISAFLSGIMIKVGAYGIIRVISPNIRIEFPVVNIGNILSLIIIVVAILSMFIGVFLALIQTDVKRLLAYHSISQMGYILLGIGLGTKLGLAGGLYHIINHAIFKGLLFLGVGAVIFKTGSKKLVDLGGLWKKMPVTTIVCIVAALSISGIPPFNGFASKMILGKAVAEFSIILKYMLTMASAFTFASFFKLIKCSFFGKIKESLNSVQEAPLLMLIPMIVLSAFCIILGLQANTVMNQLMPVAMNEPVHYQMSSNVVFWTEGLLVDTLFTILLGFTVYFIAMKMGLIDKADKSSVQSIPLLKRESCLSIDSLYCYFAILTRNSCQKLNKIYSRDFNIHLSWIALTIIILFIILLIFLKIPLN